MTRSDDLKRQIAELDSLIRTGVLSGEAARQARSRLEDELLAQVLGPVPAPGADPRLAAPAEPRAAAAAAPPPSWAAEARPSRRLWLAVTGFVLAVGVGGYAWLGNFAGWSATPATAGPVAAAAAGAHQTGVAQIEGLVEHLAQRLASAPDDAEGWAMLGRSYSVLGRFAESLPAYRRAIALRPQDAQAHADLADALGSANGQSLDGEPEQLIAKALQLDPDNVKALSLSGTLQFNRGDAAAAARQWAHALRGLDPDSDMARRVQGALDQARQRAGLPALPLASTAASAVAAVTAAGPNAAASARLAAPAPAPASSAAPAAASSASIQGRITLAAGLRAQAAPDDTLFVFARPVAGAKAPLAILRKQVKDLPLDFTLDDRLAMSPALRLSSVREVHVGARISKSGNAMPQAGDLQGLTAAVPVGTRGVQLEIAETIR